MRVRFLRNNLFGSKINPTALEYFNSVYDRRNYGVDKDFGRGMLEVGSEFNVYAVNTIGHSTKFYLKEPKRGIITHFPAPCFDIIDSRISKYWVFNRKVLPKRDGLNPLPIRESLMFAIREWVEEPRFLEYLVDQRNREVNIMERMITLMDKE